MLKPGRTWKRSEVRTPVRKRRMDLIESRGDLRQLIYWMENDRSLDAQPEKIFFLKKLLVDIEDGIDKGPRMKIRSATI